MTKVLVTGAAGFIGGYVVEELLARGYTVVGLDNLSKYGRWARALAEHPRFVSVVGDGADKELLAELAQDCDHLIANAALIGGVGYMNDLPLDILTENNRLASAAAEVGIAKHRAGVLRKVTYVSSSMVFEHVDGGQIVEGDQLTCPPPSTAYGFQKLAVEYVARAAWEQYGLPFTIVRPFNCVGAGERRAAYQDGAPLADPPIAKGHVIPDFVERALRREDPFRILGDGQQYRTFTYARDMATGIVLAMEKESALNEDFNLSGDQGCRVGELAELIWEMVNPGRPLHIEYVASYPNDVRIRRPDIEKARKLLGFDPATPLETMVREVIDWVRAEIIGRP
ncbi:NAD(P)-dependent oxidoreductase [Nocardia terpenica]|uniref:NAD-dependent epimerase/dehydratase family protein n=1 Tax=Nocardia terpenica TaxID=455432 RepID=UPI001896377A|nr:NAD(P)-dependent oxidoreductase [Nocardia terpenica]MBF6063288.1 NAD(P)-dependent oxidoreductase [Nocardia terpenica]MBF6105844.1 NAD(P)-dependent oxidoreductase [Nocardia terpenica]MBF6113572.1 NAD(P)-dependent oxidoreductase [Nocardia terpenica]MBF6119585.1 NAD(P)-dependent oxidoreductase [Nocardia terpenica]MBF6151996.1 NAD(P)-dependent oxidoreductase [Nocardia terpenica]